MVVNILVRPVQEVEVGKKCIFNHRFGKGGEKEEAAVLYQSRALCMAWK
jgi:hypothetical protein